MLPGQTGCGGANGYDPRTRRPTKLSWRSTVHSIRQSPATAGVAPKPSSSVTCRAAPECHAGWYDELLGFLNNRRTLRRVTPRKPARSADLDEAGSMALQAHRLPLTPGATPGTLSTVQWARMAYAIGALSQLPGP